MANTLTGLIPTIRESLDTVSRELVGFIPASWSNPDGKQLERAAKGQSITFPITPQGSLEDITPGQLPANSGSQTIGSETMTISKSKAYPILWNGEEVKSLSNGDRPQINPILMDQFSQGFRTLANAVEADLWAEAYQNASRAAGTAGTLPFATAGDLSDFANSLKILNENGSPTGDLHMILGNSSAANLRAKQSVLFKVNEAGTSGMLRNGELGRVQGFGVGESNQIGAHTKGTGASYVTDTGATYPVGTTTIHVDTGTGTILAGDVVTFAGDSNKYIVVTGFAGDGDGDIVIAGPGLQQTLADGVAMTIGASTTESNVFFDRRALVLVSRMPALPDGGDSADDRMTMQDPISGLAFEVALYRQYRQVKYEISLAWGVKSVKPAHSGLLLG